LIILGIADSHEAHACVVKSGRIVSAAVEERFSRIKTDCGYPSRAIEKVIEESGIKANEIDLVVMAGINAGLFYTITKPQALFSVEDWIFQNENYWKPKLIDKKPLNSLDDFELFEHKIDNIKDNPYFGFVDEARKNPTRDHYEILNKYRRKAIIDQINIDEKKIKFVRHEDCHQYYGYYSQVDFKSKVLLFTIEGGGDDSSATVSIAQDGSIKEKYKTNEAMLGRLYRYITLLLGMKPCQHEYKVMGLAPYGSQYHGKKSLEHFRNYDEVRGHELVNKNIYDDVYYSSKDALEGQRFDGIAWGLQTYLEETLEKWIVNNIKKYNIKDIVLSGGVAQNIKAIQALIKNPNINSVWAGPISGDGSLAIGAAWYAVNNYSSNDIKGLETIYLGTKISRDAVDLVISKVSKKFKIIDNYSAADVAKWIFSGLIIARCEGAMEFGQRALGNRSILADPRKADTVERINKKVKFRDFWMPFTPTICFDDCDRYLVNKTNTYSPWMTMAFDLKEGLANQLPAVVHPADKTCRAQMLKKEDNAEYYNIIKEFEKLSGHPVLLNTSFNLHGDAIVETADQAMDTFENSDIDILLMDGKAIIRNTEV